MDKHETWKRLEDLLTAALEAERLRISSHDAEEVRHYIDHNEFGLAYEQLDDALRSKSISPTETSKIAMKAAADLMNL